MVEANMIDEAYEHLKKYDKELVDRVAVDELTGNSNQKSRSDDFSNILCIVLTGNSIKRADQMILIKACVLQ